eukprot:CAMPEP_0185039028 /NCGR_PEP_ID=MMETSP1103-20130426/35435_1 /TAXON_ID=36769 /ORGANISM="Paraphysomonas bandaiensis, Strain Caron Lab Isolate" /LENGTH=751 /DNA_ID=CAMNT_0027577757 /DNA_START=760 /DNA_END=3015 /DNA_ORIENTATION=-
MAIWDNIRCIQQLSKSKSIPQHTLSSKKELSWVLLLLILLQMLSFAYGFHAMELSFSTHVIEHHYMFLFTLVVVNIYSVLTSRYDVEVALVEQKIFMRNLSHEIRTPLNAAFVGLQLMKESIVSKNQNQTVIRSTPSMDGDWQENFQPQRPPRSASSHLEESYTRLMVDSMCVPTANSRRNSRTSEGQGGEFTSRSRENSVRERVEQVSGRRVSSILSFDNDAASRVSSTRLSAGSDECSAHLRQFHVNTSVDSSRLKGTDSRYSDYIDDIMASCDIALEVLNEMLMFDKLNAGTMTMEFVVADAVSVVHTALSPLKISATHKHIRLVLPDVSEMSPTVRDHLSLCRVIVDTHKISKVLRNFVSNAIKFTPPQGHVLVDIGFEKDTDAARENERMRNHICTPRREIMKVAADNNLVRDGYLRISVTDSGVGISQDDLNLLFNQVIQIKPGQYQGGEGSGLGLLISGELVLMHSGIYAVKSDGEGTGSTFTVYLPLFIPPRRISSSSEKSESSFCVSGGLATRMKPAAAIAPVKTSSVSVWSNVNESFRRPPLDTIPSDRNLHTASDMRAASGGYDSDDVEAHSHDGKRNMELRRVLVVDDTASNRKILRRLLGSRSACSIVEAVSGTEAISIVRNVLRIRRESLTSQETTYSFTRPRDNTYVSSSGSDEYELFDMVILDYEMQDLNGPSTAQKMRNEGYTNIIIGVTGYTDEEKHKRFLDMGADAVLVKPLNLKDFDSIVTKLLSVKTINR